MLSSSPLVEGVCVKCGRTFSYNMQRNHRRRLCQECRDRNKKNDKRRTRRALFLATRSASFIEPVSNAEIMRADRKPAGVSDIRWRMELRRRANASFYAQYGTPDDRLA